MDSVQKQILGYLILTIVEALLVIGTYYLGKVNIDAFVLGILIGLVAALGGFVIKWIKYTFKLPEIEDDIIEEGSP